MSSQLTELFIANPKGILNADSRGYVHLSTMSPEEFGTRLQVVLDTFWDLTLIIANRIGNLSSQDLGERGDNEKVWSRANAIGSRTTGDR